VVPPNPEQFRTLIEYSSEIIAILDASGTIRYANPAAGRALKCPPEELAGKRIFELIHPKEVRAVTELSRRVLRIPGAVESIQWRARRPDGSWRVLRGVMRNLLHLEAVAGVVLIARDITGRKRLEGQLRQAQRMAAMGQLAGGVAHEFSNLLSVILCYTELALEALDAGNPLRLGLEEVLGAGERASALVSQLLSFSSPQPESQQCVDLNQLVGNMIHTLAPILDHRIQVTSALAPGLGQVKVDPAQIDQVLLNLALNSRDAMPFGGQIRIQTENLSCDSQAVPGVAAGDYVRVTFSDTGQGMDARTKSRIFDPFFTTKRRGKGTGLGLSTVHSIVEQHGGAIAVESEPAKGATFRIYLPRI
jgi:PAS domain S-box-containing protein